MEAFIQNFFTVATQVIVLFVLIAVGFVMGKRGIMGESGAKICSDIALLVATPCVIANSFRRECTPEVLTGLLLSMGAALLVHGINIAVAHIVYRGKSDRDAVLRLGTVLSNAGFMALPLQQAILGNDGVFYGAAYVVVFNLVLWSYGQMTMDRDAALSFKKVVFNPGVIGLLMGVVILLVPYDLPTVVSAPLSHLAALNTPIPMLFIGYYLSKVDFKTALKDPVYWGGSAVRLLVVPIVATAVLYLVGVRGVLLTAMSIASTAPVAAGVAMFATRYGRDTQTAVNLVALSTVLSLVTMPILVALTQIIA